MHDKNRISHFKVRRASTHGLPARNIRTTSSSGIGGKRRSQSFLCSSQWSHARSLKVSSIIPDCRTRRSAEGLGAIRVRDMARSADEKCRREVPTRSADETSALHRHFSEDLNKRCRHYIGTSTYCRHFSSALLVGTSRRHFWLCNAVMVTKLA